MKVVLIQPPALQSQDSYSSLTQPPLGLAYLAAYAREMGHQVEVIDAVGSALEKASPWPGAPGLLIQGLELDEIAARVPKDAEVVGFSCMFTHAWPMVRELMKRVKAAVPHAYYIAGGEHCTSMYEQVLNDAPIDLVCYGEGEVTFGEVLKKLVHGDRDWSKSQGVCYKDAAGQVVRNPRQERIREPDTLPYPDWDALNIQSYMDQHIFMGPSAKNARSIPLLATRGCPYACTFCASPNMWTRMYRTRDPKKVVDEIEHWMKKYGANDFQFQDLTAIVRKEWIVEFCSEVVNRGLKITWQIPVGTRSEAIDKEVTDLLMASGCHHVTYAPESGSKKILKAIDKKVDLDRLVDSAKAALSSGMGVCLFMIVGFPQETEEDIRLTFQFIRRMARLGIHEIAVSTFVPLPGTELFGTTNAIRPIVVDDAYCYRMTGATRLFHIESWNPRFSNAKLRFFKLAGMAQFYLLSFLTHPSRVWQMIRAAVTDEQKTKSDRVIREFGVKLKRKVTTAVKDLLPLG
jgi:anaerobic magnesium-protoporphyrin IX monomethyl ester cyclase